MTRSFRLALAIVAMLTATAALAQTTQPAASSPAAPKIARPTEVIPPAGCVTAECHPKVKDYKVVHGPVNVNGCDACHKLVDAKTHKYELARPKTETCTFCHQIDTGNLPVVHKPLKDGDCLACHDPHGGNTPKFVRGQTMKELCNTCHQDVVGDKQRVHGPVAAGACESCHQPHASAYPKLLAAEGRDMCLSCHTEMKNQMARVKFTHKAVERNCTDCHDPHASNYAMQVKQPPVQLCTSCHEHDAIKNAIENSKHKHSIVIKDEGCLNCHTAHGGDLAKLMRTEPVKVCMRCHDKPIKVDSTHTVASVAEVLDPKMIKHGPIREGNCAGCHNVHGSDQTRLLAKNYSNAFYQGFSEEKYDLCFSCHDKQLVEAKQARGLTGFRNGDENLHFVHVNKAEKGRNCRSCHSTHASANELHVRNTVPYGKWEMPINYQKTETGGGCAPGCHKAYTYDREKPAVYSSGSQLATGQSQAIAPTTRPALTPQSSAAPGTAQPAPAPAPRAMTSGPTITPETPAPGSVAGPAPAPSRPTAADRRAAMGLPPKPSK